MARSAILSLNACVWKSTMFMRDRVAGKTGNIQAVMPDRRRKTLRAKFDTFRADALLSAFGKTGPEW